MKTPREILFARHRSAEPKLDEIREAAVAAVCDRRHAEANSTTVADRRQPDLIGFLRELFRLKPQAWAGLTAVWVVILALKLSTHDGSHTVAKKSSVPPEVIAEVRKQKLFFAELAGLRETRDVERPKTFLLRPRSALCFEIFAA